MGKRASGRYWVGFDLGGTKMYAALFDAGFKLVASERKKTRAAEGNRAGLKRMVALIRTVLDRAEVPARRLGGIGVGSPGPLDLRRGTILDTPNLGWRNVPLKDRLEDAFGCPVVVGNDVDVGTYGEYRFGAGRGARCVLGVFPGTGIGGGCVYDGRILRGTRASCLEIGHVKVVPDGPRCGCGGRGCLESVASRLAISAEAAAAVFRGEAPNLARLAGTDLAAIRSSALAEAIRKGDAVVEGIVRRAAGYVGLAIGDAVNLLAPEVVVLGGGLVEAMPELYLRECREAAERAVMAPFRGTFRIRTAKLGDRAGIFGAAALAAEPQAMA